MSGYLQSIVPAIAGLLGAAIGSGSVLLSGYLQQSRATHSQNNERLLEKAETLYAHILQLNTLVQDYIHDIGKQALTVDTKDTYSGKIMSVYYNINVIADLYFPKVIFDPSKKQGTKHNYLEVYLLEIFRNQNADAGMQKIDQSEARRVENRLNDMGGEVVQRLDAYVNEVVTYIHRRMGLYDFRRSIAKT